MREALLVGCLLFSTSAQSYYYSYKSWLAGSQDERSAYIAGAFDSFVFYYDTDEGHETNEHFRACVDRLRLSPQKFSEELANFAIQNDVRTGTIQALIVDYLVANCGRYKGTFMQKDRSLISALLQPPIV